MSIDWRSVQQRLGVSADGVPGVQTYTALFRAMGATDAATGMAQGAALYFPRYGIDTGLRLAHFLGQCAHETQGFQAFEEVLGYSAKRLCIVWPRRFPTLDSAEPYANNPEALANKVYGGRMGNVLPGDGWKYRGRGIVHLTGKANYAGAQNRTGIPVHECPPLAKEPQWAILIACDFWKQNGINAAADRDDLVAVTKAVNGGSTGIQERRAKTIKAKGLLGV